MHYPHPIIAKEGWPFLVLFFAFALVFTLGDPLWSVPFWLLFVFSLQFFRDPPRIIAGDANEIVSSADGRVIVIEDTEDPWRKCPAIKISVFMNVLNVHSNRAPVAGVVKEKWYHSGKFFNAALSKASLENERCAMHLKTVSGHDITCVQIAGLVARRILNYAKPETSYAKGERYGFIRFGSRVDLYLPTNAKIKVALGDKVYAASSILAELPTV